MINERLIFAGFGGQGVMTIGQMLAYCGMYEDKQVIWLPSYGPEMRGGTANCSVIISDAPVSSPVVTAATAIIVMNNPSFEKFLPHVISGGDVFINSSLIDLPLRRGDVNMYYIPANAIAEEIGNIKVANMAIAGAYLAKHDVVKLETVESVLRKTMTGAKEKLIPLNLKAIELGKAYMQKNYK